MYDLVDIYIFFNYLVFFVLIEKSFVGKKKIIKIMVRIKYIYIKI